MKLHLKFDLKVKLSYNLGDGSVGVLTITMNTQLSVQVNGKLQLTIKIECKIVRVIGGL